MCLVQTQWELWAANPHPPPSRSTKRSKNVCERFGGGSPERQIELRSQLESLKLCYSSSADSRSTRPRNQRALPLTETCVFFFLIPAHIFTLNPESEGFAQKKHLLSIMPPFTHADMSNPAITWCSNILERSFQVSFRWPSNNDSKGSFMPSLHMKIDASISNDVTITALVLSLSFMSACMLCDTSAGGRGSKSKVTRKKKSQKCIVTCGQMIVFTN